MVGVIKMNNLIYERFANVILELEPNLQMSKDEIQAFVKIHGLEHFCQKINNQAKEFIEVIEIIERLESHGDEYD